MTIVELQKILGERIEVALKEGMSLEQRAIETGKSTEVATLAKQLINAGDLMLRTEKLISEGKVKAGNRLDKFIG